MAAKQSAAAPPASFYSSSFASCLIHYSFLSCTPTSHPPHIPTHTLTLQHTPNSTLVSKDNKLTTILGRHALPAKAFSLGPLGNLLHKGHPVPAGAAFNSKGHLIAADTTTVLYP